MNKLILNYLDSTKNYNFKGNGVNPHLNANANTNNNCNKTISNQEV